ncbi:MAG TPA: S8 family serine peptidase [Thermoanaerobaculia bacterium]|nr:S8 family serine peptidase [Thermoanaerobaculia bacterium]
MVRFACAVLVVVGTVRVSAQVSSTHCAETEIPLGGSTSVSTLDRCGDDLSAPLLWHLDRIDQVDGALDGHFDRRNGGAGSVIYIMDTGVLATHTEFATAGGTRVIAGFDATQTIPLGRSKCTSANKAVAPCYDSLEELPSASHGTGVASIAAGKNVGVAPEATVVSIRVMNERGLATTRTYLDGLNAIVAHAWDPASPNFRTAVVNISGWVLERLNGTSFRDVVVPYAAVEQKIREMIGGVDANGRPDPTGKRFLFVVAANNTDGGCGPAGMIDRFPALLGQKIDGVITVGGMTADNRAWSGTCRGGVEVLAPAQGIFSATITSSEHYRGRRPNLRSGTSFAAPIIAGIAARMLAERPDLSPQQLEWWIASTPSRVVDPSALLADGRVAHVPAPATRTASSTTARATLER